MKMFALVVLACVSAAVMAAPQLKPSGDQHMPNMYTALNVDSMIKAFDPKFVVVNEQRGEMPEGVHDALVKSLISDLHGMDVPVVYAKRRDLTAQ